jgi:hypothetical protein
MIVSGSGSQLQVGNGDRDGNRCLYLTPYALIQVFHCKSCILPELASDVKKWQGNHILELRKNQSVPPLLMMISLLRQHSFQVPFKWRMNVRPSGLCCLKSMHPNADSLVSCPNYCVLVHHASLVKVDYISQDVVNECSSTSASTNPSVWLHHVSTFHKLNWQENSAMAYTE